MQEIKTDAAEKIEVQTIDSFCLANGISCVDFLKLDVEGHEMSIFAGRASNA